MDKRIDISKADLYIDNNRYRIKILVKTDRYIYILYRYVDRKRHIYTLRRIDILIDKYLKESIL